VEFVNSIGLGHIGLNVTDLNAAQRFFSEALRFETVAEGGHNDSPFVLLGHRGGLTLTLWQQSNGAFSTSQPGLHHLAFAVDDIERLRELHAHLIASGVTFFYDGKIVPHSEGKDSSAIYFAGPDGIRLEVYAPNGGKTLTAPVSGAPSCGFF